MRGALLALACLGACAPAPSELSPGVEIWTLSADGYGPVRIGMTPDEAAAALGYPLLSRGAEAPEVCANYHFEPEAPFAGLHILALNGRIASITDVGAEGVATPEGVRVGASGAEARAAYPGAEERPAQYDPPPAHSLIAWTVPGERGLRFIVDPAGRVGAIVAGDESILLSEGCS